MIADTPTCAENRIFALPYQEKKKKSRRVTQGFKNEDQSQVHLVGGPGPPRPEKYELTSIGMSILFPNINGKITNGNQTTNQSWLLFLDQPSQ